MPMSQPEQDDLTADDHLVEQTSKDAPNSPDLDLPDPPQDPSWVPPSVIDASGDRS
jgi:hypothetical protein